MGMHNIHEIQFNAYTVAFCLYTERMTISLLGACTQPETDGAHDQPLEFMFPFVAQVAAQRGVSSFSQHISIVASTQSCVGNVDSIGCFSSNVLTKVC